MRREETDVLYSMDSHIPHVKENFLVDVTQKVHSRATEILNVFHRRIQSGQRGNPRHFCGVTSTGGSARIAWAESYLAENVRSSSGTREHCSRSRIKYNTQDYYHDARLPRLQKHV
eukprot:scaffold6495_cov155-Skeletonema_marinoi.AAC.6